ncbi:MAG: heavy metal translocating P-type ATPase [Thermomicrobiales bacterium]
MSETATIGTGADVGCRIDVSGMDCGDCAKTIEASLGALPGVRSATVNFVRGTAEVAYAPERIGRPAIEERIKALGYGVAPPPMPAIWTFDVAGMDCGDCAKTIEAGLRRLPEVASASVNFASGRLSVTPADGTIARDAVLAAVAQAGYAATVATPHGAAPPSPLPWWQARRVLETGVAAMLWLAGFAVERAGAPRVASAAPFLLAMLGAGHPIARAGWYALRARRADMNLLMTVAAVGAVGIGRWDEGSSVLILFAIGLTLQNLTVDRTRQAIKALVALAPAEALVVRDGREVVVPVAEVGIGETVLVRAGDRVPVDGVVARGVSAIDQSSITGESVPVEVAPESAVFAGRINGDGVIEVRATEAAGDTTLARIIHLVEEAQASRAPAQAFVDRFAAVYTPIVVGGALLLATAVPLLVGDYRLWIFKALVLLVVACPCALVISTPVALVAAIGSASRRGVLFKGGAAIEALAGVRAVAFDNTGTLTAGRPSVSHVIPFGALTEAEVLSRAAAVEARSTHPLARGIARAAGERGLAAAPVTDELNLPGQGVQAVLDEATVLVGSRRLFPVRSKLIEETLAGLEREGRTAVLVGTPEGIDGIIALADPLRPSSRDAVAALHALGLRTVMLTGDNRAVAERIGREVGVAEIAAELLPEEKMRAITDVQRGSPTAMIGDGVNDAPALATAAVGIAMGAGGTDVAIEAADVVLMGDDLAQLPVAVRLARRTMATIRGNIGAAIAVKGVFLILTFAGVTNLWLAVLADMGMSLLVTLNSLRLIRLRAEPRRASAVAPIAGSRPLLGSAGD